MLNKKITLGYSLVNKIKAGTVPTASVIRKLSSTSEETIKEKYDVIIAGGGMVGCTLACAFGKKSLFSNLKILLLEGSPNSEYNVCKAEYSNRVVALNHNTKALMTSLGAWRHIEERHVQPVRHMQVWDACSDALITFNRNDVGDDLAYIVENDLVLHAVKTELQNACNINTVYNAKISSYKLPNEGNSLQSVVKMSNGDAYACDLLIGADGGNSAVRKAMGVQYVSWNYDQMGLVATLQLADSSENTTAWQRFLPTGPVALLPLDSDHSSLVWSTSKDQAKQLLSLPEDQFVDTLNDALWKQYPRPAGIDSATAFVGSCLRRCGLPDGAVRQLPPSVRAIVPKSRAAFPLGFGHSTKYIAPGVVLIGDAAHKVHPLAGQGVNLGFGDVKDLTDLLADAVYAGLDINHASWQRKYETARQRHNVPTQFVIDALHRLYTVDLPPVVLLRTVGLQITNAVEPVKRMIMSHATS